MHLSRAACTFVLTTSTALFTDAFLSPTHVTVPARLSATIQREAAAPSAEISTPSTFHDVQKLTFRELQRHCKSAGLEAVGSTAVLRGRLLGHYGLLRENNFEAQPDAGQSPKEIEVGVLLRNCRSYCFIYLLTFQTRMLEPISFHSPYISGTLCH